MLWLIVPAGADKDDNKALQASAGRLQGNKAIPPGQTDTLIVSTGEAEAFEPAKISADEPKVLHVVAHAGLEKGGHLGGLDLAGFAAALVSKFGSRLAGAEVYLHVCYIGRTLDGLLDAVKHADNAKALTGTAFYAPLNLMIVSKAGIPHVLGDPNAKSEMIDPIVAKHDSDYSVLRKQAKLNFLSTGEGWAGYKLSGAREVKPIDAEKIQGAVLGTFDESEMEVGEGY
jgi:hypothetical protein